MYDLHATKQATNLTINSDLLRVARELDVKLSSVAEAALAEAVRQELAARWERDNAAAIAEYNERIEKRGLFSDGLRLF